jgi:hypothetical protein
MQVTKNNSNVPFIRGGSPLTKVGTLLQDAGRAAVLAPFTLVAKVAASQKYVPFTDETAVNGSAIPAGIYLGSEVAAADLVAGDVADAVILVGGGGVTIDVDQLVIENSKTLNTVITVGTTQLTTVRDHLANRGIFAEETVDVTGYENA